MIIIDKDFREWAKCFHYSTEFSAWAQGPHRQAIRNPCTLSMQGSPGLPSSATWPDPLPSSIHQVGTLTQALGHYCPSLSPRLTKQAPGTGEPSKFSERQTLGCLQRAMCIFHPEMHLESRTWMQAQFKPQALLQRARKRPFCSGRNVVRAEAIKCLPWPLNHIGLAPTGSLASRRMASQSACQEELAVECLPSSRRDRPSRWRYLVLTTCTR